MVQLLDTFREKYPGYNDLNDSDLADMLSKKYPDAYGDLPGLVGNETTQIEPIKKEEPVYISESQEPNLSQFDFQGMTKSILDQYNKGNCSPRKIEMFDELKKRGAFEMPMSLIITSL